MGSIGVKSSAHAEIGVATENGKSYYLITTLLKRSRIPYVDVLLRDYSHYGRSKSLSRTRNLSTGLKLIITTRKERLQILGDEVVCIEDLGEEIGLARQKLLSILHPLRETDRFVVGIDPGERIGIAAFMNQIEVDSTVLWSVEDTISRTQRLLDNAPNSKKIVRIGSGMPQLARKMADRLNIMYGRKQIRIQLVDERGTSSLSIHAKASYGTRDQRAARLIAFREGRDYSSVAEFRNVEAS